MKGLAPEDRQRNVLYTIGHSNLESFEFVALLRQFEIQLVVDVRSSPYSRYVPQANRDSLAGVLDIASID